MIHPGLVDSTNPRDQTSWLSTEVTFDHKTPPELGRLDPPAGWATQPKPEPLTNENGRIIIDRDGRPILDWGIPRYISSNISIKRMEYWFRKHPRFSYHDIWARQPSWVPKPTLSEKNAVSNRRWREVRRPLRTRCFLSRSPGVTKVSGSSACMMGVSTAYTTRVLIHSLFQEMVEFVEGLTPQQLVKNTSWDITPDGIVEPGNARHILPLNYFCDNGLNHVPSKEITDALAELSRLQGLAIQNGVDHWTQLHEKLLPHEWFMRRGKRNACGVLKKRTRKMDSAGEMEQEAKTPKRRKNPLRGVKIEDNSYMDYELEAALTSEDGLEESSLLKEDFHHDSEKDDVAKHNWSGDNFDEKIGLTERVNSSLEAKRTSHNPSNRRTAQYDMLFHHGHIKEHTSPTPANHKRRADAEGNIDTQKVVKHRRHVSAYHGSIT